MNIKNSYDEGFTTLLQTLKKKYGEDIFNLEGIGKQLDSNYFSAKLFSSETSQDHSVDANGNITDFIPATYINEVGKPMMKLNSLYLIWKSLSRDNKTELANKIIEEHITGGIYINDLHGIASGQSYCYNFSTLDIVNKGLPMVSKIKTIPPKHLYSFKSQIEQFIAYASNSIMGATGIADLLLSMSWYVDNIIKNKSDAHYTFATEKDCWNYVRENLVSLIYTLNQPFRSGIQSPFTNVSIYDNEFLKSMQLLYIFPNGDKLNIDTVMKLQRLFVNIMNDELDRTPITFPVTTACFATTETNNIIDEDFLDFISEENMKYGFINIYCGKSSTLSSCCRLRSDTENAYFNSFGAGKTKIGSLGVCTINFARLAKNSKDHNDFLTKLKEYIKLSVTVNNVRRKLIQQKIDDGFLSLYKLGFMDEKTQYSTVGINGLNEAVNIMGLNILEEDGQRFVKEILSVVNNECDFYQNHFHSPHNTEQIPAENAAVKLADKDRLLGYNTGDNSYEVYSNQFIPLTINADVLDRIHLQGLFDKDFSGGSILHINVDQRINDVRKIKRLIRYTTKQGVIYFAINYNLQKCINNHMSVGLGKTCDICGDKITDNFIRVVGFLVNTKNFNPVRKRVDLPFRKFYKNLIVPYEEV